MKYYNDTLSNSQYHRQFKNVLTSPPPPKIPIY